MSERTDYTAVAERIDYAKLERKLDQLQDRPPPQRRKKASDVLEPVREKLLRMRANGWSYEQITAELNEAGLPVKVGTLRDYLGNGHGAKRSAPRQRRNRRTANATSGGH
jgi:hypothetical protein